MGIALAGFTSIIGLLGTSARQWTEDVSVKFWIMIEFSLATVFFSLLPFAPHYLGASSEITWAISSGLMAVFVIAHVAVSRPRIQRLSRNDEWTGRAAEPVIGLLLLSVVAIQSLNALKIGFARNLGAYYLGLLFLLAFAATAFVLLMLAIRKASGRAV